MKALFSHDTPFYFDKGIYYSSGINKSVLSRYLKIFDSIIVCGRQYTDISNHNGNIASTENIEFKNIPYRNSIFIWFDKNSRDHIYNLVNNVDFVIARLDSIIGFLAIKYARKLRIPYAVELCTDPWDCYINYGLKGKLLAPWITYKTRNEVQRATNVIYVTNNYLQKKYPCKNNTIAISNVECEPQHDIASKKIESYQTRKDTKKLVLGTAGALLPFKGQKYVIEAMKILKEKGVDQIYYKLAGNGSDLEKLKELAAKYGLNNKIVFCGTLNSLQMKDFYDSLDIYIQPSLQEGLPRTVIEAMSRGLCCIGSRTAGIPELLPENRIFEKKDVKGIVRMIESISEDDMIRDSKHNFMESCLYDKNILDRRRTGFFKSIIGK